MSNADRVLVLDGSGMVRRVENRESISLVTEEPLQPWSVVGKTVGNEQVTIRKCSSLVPNVLPLGFASARVSAGDEVEVFLSGFFSIKDISEWNSLWESSSQSIGESGSTEIYLAKTPGKIQKSLSINDPSSLLQVRLGYAFSGYRIWINLGTPLKTAAAG